MIDVGVAAVPSVATLAALAEPCDAPTPVVVAYRLLLCPDVLDAMDRSKARIGLDEVVPGLLWWMMMRPVEPESDPYVVMSCWGRERDYWAWLRNNAACLSDIVTALEREHGRVLRAAPKSTIWRVSHYAVAPWQRPRGYAAPTHPDAPDPEDE